MYSSYNYGYGYGRGGVDIVMFLITLLVSIPTILICIGMWLTWAKAKANQLHNTTGLTLIKVGVIIEMVLIIVSLSICILICLIAAFGAGYISDEVMLLMLLYVLILIGALVLCCIYYNKLRALIASAKNIATGMNYVIPGIIYLCVFFGIAAFFTFISLFIYLIAGSIMMFFISLMQTALYVMLIVYLVNVHNKLKAVVYQESQMMN